MPLLNSLINSVVCVGFSSEHGLVIDKQSDNNNSPLLSYVKPYVLAVLTADQALYPQSKGAALVDELYPFVRNSTTTTQKKSTKLNTFTALPLFCCPDGVKASRQQEESRIHHIVFTEEDGTRNYAVVLTFQQKFQLKTDIPDEDGIYQIHSLTHTTKKTMKKPPLSYIKSNTLNNNQDHDELSNSESSDQSSSKQPTLRNSHNYLFNQNNSSRMQRSSSLSSNRTSVEITYNPLEPFYLPHCIVLVSSHPYWTAMQELISIIYEEIRKNDIKPCSDAYMNFIKRCAFLACNIPILPMAWERFQLPISLNIDQSILTLDPPLHTNRTVVDLDLSNLFLILNIGKVIDILSAILTERPIVIFSADYPKLVTILECFQFLIYPLKWIHVYIPILPDSLREYLEGPPGTYIIGAHSRHQKTVENLDLSFTCNIDNNTNLHIPSNAQFYHIPSSKLQRFIKPITKLIEKVKTARSLQNVNTPIRLRVEEQREFERKNRLETNEKIIEIFLDLMVDLLEDALNPIYWTIDHPRKDSRNSFPLLSTLNRNSSFQNQTKFSKEKYLESKPEGPEEDFYREFIETTAFSLFIEQEMSSSTQTEFKKICRLRTQVDLNQPLELKPKLSVRSSLSSDKIQTETLQLPDGSLNNTSTHYLDDCIELFNSKLETAQEERSIHEITVFGYLCGCALLARGHLLDGIRNLYLIENLLLFPKKFIEGTIVPLLIDASLFDIFQHEKFYIESPQWKKVERHPFDDGMLTISLGRSGNSADHLTPTTPTTRILLMNDYIIDDSFSFEQFHEHLHDLCIVFDHETTRALFKALLYWMQTPKKPTDTFSVSRRWSFSDMSVNRDNNRQQYKAPTNSKLPAEMFKVFLQKWQQTNVEKERMKSHLPKDRRNQESILMISSPDVTLNKDGCGTLILTQRGIYFSQDDRPILLVTELSKIVFLEIYQHKILFLSNSAIRIYALHTSSASPKSSKSRQDGEPTAMLYFKDDHELKFWYKIIYELWAGVSIAQAQCDTTVLQKASRHIALIDALTKIDNNTSTTDKYSTKSIRTIPQNRDQGNLDVALNDFFIFTQMKNTGAFKTLTDETRKAIYDRLSPSMNEPERYAVRCLLFTDNSDNNYSLLWSAYGPKLKIFNTVTWTCDPYDLSFPSLIKCMCLDASNKLWIGCNNGLVFIVDTNQRICGTQIGSINDKGGCESMAFDMIRNQMLIVTQSGLISIWDATTKRCLTDINLEETYEQTFSALSSNKIRSIQIYDNHLFVCYRDDYVLVFGMTNSNTFVYEDMISVQYKNHHSIPINCFLIYDQQIWISADCYIYIYNINHQNNANAYRLLMKQCLDQDHVLAMLGVSDYVWAGTLRGNIHIYRKDNYEVLKTFNGHKHKVCCLCPKLDEYVISGSGQDDTSIVIWENIQRRGSFATKS